MESKKVITLDTSVNKDIMLRVRITPYIDNELNRLSDKWGCTRSDLARVMLLNSLRLINENEEEKQEALFNDSQENLILEGESLEGEEDLQESF